MIFHWTVTFRSPTYSMTLSKYLRRKLRCKHNTLLILDCTRGRNYKIVKMIIDVTSDARGDRHDV